MKHFALFLAAYCCLESIPGHAVADSGPLRLAVDLTDGSRLIGVTRNDSIRIRGDFGNLQVALSVVDYVRWKQDREHVVVEFPNGDHLTGAIVPEPVQLTTLFGDIRISMEHIAVLKRLPSGSKGGLALLDGLVLYFPFDEPPQAGMIPSKVGALSGKLQGGQWVPQGHRGGAFKFTNPDDSIIVPDHDSLRPAKLTIAAWVNPDESTRSSSTWRGIVTKVTSGSWTGGYGLARYPGKPDAHFFVNYYSSHTAHMQIPDNTWTHLVGTYDEQTLNLYVNGLKASSVVPKGSYGGPIQHENSPLLIGQGPNGYGWFGMIDEVMLFNRVLSADEVAGLYRLTKGD